MKEAKRVINITIFKNKTRNLTQMFLYFQQTETISTKVMSVGKPMVGGPYSMVDHNGRPVNDSTFRGKYVLMYFGFTHCPDICPAELSRLAVALNLLGTSPPSFFFFGMTYQQ
jgi:cytochrome oxidase Cu insertion factor (SCO1/SenC/PrrC family)